MSQFDLSMLKDIMILENEPLSAHTYTKVGGVADFLAFPKNRQELARIIAEAQLSNTPWMILGNGSNLIIRDGGIRGVVICLDELNEITVSGYTIEAEAGAAIIDVSRVALESSLSGLEFACGIPGSVGGAIYMNAGAYGGEIAHCLVSVQIMTKDGEIVTIKVKDLKFGYRLSAIQEMNAIILSAKFALIPGDPSQIKQEMDRLTHLRELKQPLDLPSCGSVFKRPNGYFAGQLISEAGLQGMRVGGVEVSTKHAGFMVNVDNGTAKDYEQLIDMVITTVEAHSGVRLETEVRIIGEEAVLSKN